MTLTLSRTVLRSAAVLGLVAGMLSGLATGCASANSTEAKALSPSVLSAHDLSSFSYKSSGGTDKGLAVSWLQSDPLRLAFREQNGVLTAIVNTPCNTVNVPVEVEGLRLLPDTSKIASTAMGCLDEAGTEEQWATAFFSKTMTIDRTKDTLTLKTDDAELDLVS